MFQPSEIWSKNNQWIMWMFRGRLGVRLRISTQEQRRRMSPSIGSFCKIVEQRSSKRLL